MFFVFLPFFSFLTRIGFSPVQLVPSNVRVEMDCLKRIQVIFFFKSFLLDIIDIM